MDVPEEEWDEKEWDEEESGRGRRGKRRGLRRGRREQEEEIRRGLSNKRYVSSCIIEDSSLTIYWLFIYCLQMDERQRIEDGGCGRRQLKMIKNLERYVIFILYCTK